MKQLQLLTFGVSAALSLANSAHAADRIAQYYTVDTTQFVTLSQLIEVCNHDADVAENKLAQVSKALTGNAMAMQVVGYYGQTTNQPGQGPIGTVESYCYLAFTSYDKTVGFDAGSLVHYTHLSAATWDTACKPQFDAGIADPNTIVIDYQKSSTLFQGRICDVTTVRAAKN